MSNGNRKRGLIGAVVTILVIAAGAAAYWTATGGVGDGTGTADTVLPVVANQSTVLTPMYPGDSPQTISGVYVNPNPGTIHVTTITASIFSVTKAAGAPTGTCAAADFSLTNAIMTENDEVPAADTGTWSGAQIQFNNTTANQDACKGATVVLHYTIS